MNGYDTKRRLSKITHNNFDYDFTYDGMGRVSGISIAGESYCTNEYDTLGQTTTVTTKYGPREKMSVTTDRHQKPIKKTYTGEDCVTTTIAEAQYDEFGKVKTYLDKVTGERYNYTYNELNEVESETRNDQLFKTYNYDFLGRLNSSITYLPNDGCYTALVYNTLFERNVNANECPADSVIGTSLSGVFESKYTKDNIGRTTARTLDAFVAKKKLSEEYEYLDTDTILTSYVSKLTQKVIDKQPNREDIISSCSYSYSYDANGNISEVSKNGVICARYKYNTMDQLIQEDNNELGYTFTYSYDNSGNILSKRKYPYTTGDLASPIYTYQYTYDTQNGDRLICYNGQEFEYDSKGNPTKYRGTDLVWDRVRLLERFGGHTFSYNAEGIRTRKDGTTYLLDGSNILKETRANGKDILYYYDGTGVCGFRYECKDYFYAKNLQGDVTDIYGADGVLYATYKYDAWGNHSPVPCIDKDGIGTLNPFRYRCYYYDTETGLYYVKSRYYDPVVGRFVNVDDPAVLTATPTELTDKNLYSYCDNNPVTRADYGGECWHIVVGAAVGAVAGVVGQVISDVVTSVLNGEVTISNWQTYTGAAVGGAAGGVVLATMRNINAANAVTGTVTTVVGQSLEKLTIKNYNKSWAEIGVNAAVDGAVSYGLGKIPGIKGATAGRNSWFAVYKSGLTKLRNGTAARMSAKVVAKGLGSSIVGGFALDGYYGVKQYAYDRVKSLLN